MEMKTRKRSTVLSIGLAATIATGVLAFTGGNTPATAQQIIAKEAKNSSDIPTCVAASKAALVIQGHNPDEAMIKRICDSILGTGAITPTATPTCTKYHAETGKEQEVVNGQCVVKGSSSGSTTTVAPTATTSSTIAPTTATTVASTSGLRTPYRTPTAQPSQVTGTREFVCENIWSGVQCDLGPVPAVGTNEAYLAHGDVKGNGRCGVMVWDTGKPTGLAAGTWKLYRIHGPSADHLNDGFAVEQEIAAAGLEKGCPLVK